MPVSKLSDSLTANGSKKTYQSFLAENPSQTPNAWDSISTTVLSSPQSSVTISPIPQSYGILRIHVSAKTNTVSDTTENFYVRFNSDSGSNYTRQYMYANNNSGTLVLGSQISQGYAYCGILPRSGGSQGNVFGFSMIEIYDYNLTTKNKTWIATQGLHNGNSSLSTAGYQGGAWLNNNAITSITFIPGDTNFVSGSIFAVYGLKG